ncbi:MAG: oligosaccharide flippase family protein, partial [Candidatus Woesearchaeota archaeon]
MMSSKIYSNNIKSFVSAGGALFLALFCAYVITFLFELILARYLGSADYGVYKLSITILGILTVFAGMGLYGGLTRFIPLYSSKPSFVKGYISSVTKVQLIVSLSFSLLLIVFSSYI